MRWIPVLFFILNTSCGLHVHDKHESEERQPRDSSNKEENCPNHTYDTGDMCLIRKFDRCGSNHSRLCSDVEIAFIKDIEFLKQKIQSSATLNTNLASHFLLFKSEFAWNKNQTISFFSEIHDDFQIKLDNAAMMLKNMKKGDVLLFEGAHSMDELPCDFIVLHGLYCALEWSRLGKTYSPDGKYDFCTSNVALWNDVEAELNLSSLKLDEVKCYGWDDFNGPYDAASVQGLRYRNDSLVKTLSNFEFPRKNIFVTYGFFHSPIGEFFRHSQWYFMKETDFSGLPETVNPKFWEHTTVKDFYAAMPDEATTEGIFNYIQFKDVVHFVHKRLVQGEEKHLPRKVH